MVKKFNDEITKEIIKLYEEGIPLKYCASAVGIDRTTIYRWVEKGKKAKSGKYHDFYLNMQRARASFIAHHQQKIAENKDWRASQYLLQVTSPDVYVVTEQTEVKSEVNIVNDDFKDLDIYKEHETIF